MVTADLVGLSIRVRAVYQDAQRRAGAGVFSRDRGGRRRCRCRRPRRRRLCRTAAMCSAPVCICSNPTSPSFSTRSRSRSSMPPVRICSTLSPTHAWRSACARSMDRSTTWSTWEHRSDRVRRLRQHLPAAARSVLPQRPGRRRLRCNGPGPGGVITNTDFGQQRRRCRCRSAHHLQPDRRPDQQQPGGGGGGGQRRRGPHLGHR